MAARTMCSWRMHEFSLDPEYPRHGQRLDYESTSPGELLNEEGRSSRVSPRSWWSGCDRLAERVGAAGPWGAGSAEKKCGFERGGGGGPPPSGPRRGPEGAGWGGAPGRAADERPLRRPGWGRAYSPPPRGGACLRRPGGGGRSKAEAPLPQRVLTRGRGAPRAPARRAVEPGERSRSVSVASEARPVGRKAVLRGVAATTPPGGTPVHVRRRGDAVCPARASRAWAISEGTPEPTHSPASHSSHVRR